MNRSLLSAMCLAVAVVPSQSRGSSTPQVQIAPALTAELKDHQRWLESEYHEGKRLSWVKKKLDGIDLRKADLRWADLRGASLRACILVDAHLDHANLNGAILEEARLQGATLTGAKLIGAKLKSADLVGALLIGAHLDRAVATQANLNGCDLTGATLVKADLRKSSLVRTIFVPISTRGANMEEADLSFSDMRESWLVLVKLKNANLAGAQLNGARFEPLSLPLAQGISEAVGLKEIVVKDRYAPTTQLAEQLQKNGYRWQSRMLLCAINRARRAEQPIFLRWINQALFDWTCEYGANILRPIQLFGASIGLFTVAYFFLMLYPGKSRLMRIQYDDPDKPWDDKTHVVSVLPNHSTERRIVSLSKALVLCFVFSCKSQFRFVEIGSISVRRWLMEWLHHDYDLQGTRWIATWAAIQGIFGTYLIMLIVICYIWRPFSA